MGYNDACGSVSSYFEPPLEKKIDFFVEYIKPKHVSRHSLPDKPYKSALDPIRLIPSPGSVKMISQIVGDLNCTKY